MAAESKPENTPSSASLKPFFMISGGIGVIRYVFLGIAVVLDGVVNQAAQESYV